MNTFYICDTELDAEKLRLLWGNSYFSITKKDIEALLEGKTLAGCVAGEYRLFITMEETSDDSR